MYRGSQAVSSGDSEQFEGAGRPSDEYEGRLFLGRLTEVFNVSESWSRKAQSVRVVNPTRSHVSPRNGADPRRPPAATGWPSLHRFYCEVAALLFSISLRRRPGTGRKFFSTLPRESATVWLARLWRGGRLLTLVAWPFRQSPEVARGPAAASVPAVFKVDADN